ncbi:MAG: NAD-dependent epimerase/dehydratase family protein [Promethearchaeota archaeon]
MFIYGDGNQTRDFIFVKDICRANILATTTPNISEVLILQPEPNAHYKSFSSVDSQKDKFQFKNFP